MNICSIASMTAEWERRKTWRTDGSRSAAAHLARRTPSRIGECGSLLWLGRVMTDRPTVLGSLCQLGCGQVIAPAALVPFLDEAQLEAVLFETAMRPIKITRRRSFDAVQRRIIELRDRFCVCGCGLPAERCQMDHVVPWIDGGMTSVENGQARCAPTNRWKGRRHLPLP